MKPNDKLFRLVKSLDKNEKGYFKKLAKALSQTPSSNYLLLFDAIDKQEEYNENALLKKFRNTTQLPVLKNYLFELILKSLRLYHISSSIQAEINALLENVDILYNKGLTNEAEEMQQKALQKATLNANTFKQFEAEITERLWLIETTQSGWAQAIENNVNRTDDLLDDMHRQNTLYHLYAKMMHFIKVERNIRDEEHIAYIKQVINHPALSQLPDGLSFSAKVNYYMIFKIYHQLLNEDETSFAYIQKVIDIYEQYPEIIKTNPTRYLNALNNFLAICMKMHKYQLIADYINQLDKWLLNHDMRNNYRMYEYIMESNMFLGNIEKAIETNKYLRNELGKKIAIRNPGRLVILNFNIMYFMMLREDYQEALKYAAALLDMKEVEVRVDVHAIARIFYTIINYECGNTSLTESALRAARHFLKSRNNYYQAEQIVLSAISKLITAAGNHEVQTICNKLMNDLNQLSDSNQLERNFLLSCDLKPWLISKIENISPLEYVISRYKTFATA